MHILKKWLLLRKIQEVQGEGEDKAFGVVGTKKRREEKGVIEQFA